MDTAKKEENRKPRKKGTEGQKLRRIGCQGLSLVPIHEKGKGRSGHWTQQKEKKIENLEKKGI